MRVAFVTPRYAPDRGAIERHVRELARAVVRTGGEAQVLTHDHGSVPGSAESDGVVVHRLRWPAPGLPLATARGLRDALLRASACDLVHAHCDGALLTVAAGRTHPSALVFTPHCSVHRLLRWPYGRAWRSVLTSSACVICSSPSEAQTFTRAVPSVQGRLVVIPAGVDVAAIRTAAPFDARKTVVLTVARLVRHKQVHKVIAAIAGLNSTFELVVIGGGPERRSLERFAADLRVSERIRFLGEVTDAVLYRWLRTARVVVALSVESTAGRTLLAAVAAGVGVVASDIAAHRDAAAFAPHPGVTLLAPEASPLAVADAIVESAGLERPSTPEPAIPSWKEVTDRTVALYESIAAGRAMSPALNGRNPAHIPGRRSDDSHRRGSSAAI
jgi:glycosyltransferase involved in cell wall biosynthesis